MKGDKMLKKKVLATLVACIFTVFLNISSLAETWVKTPKIVAWDAPLILENGDPIPSGDVIKYNVYTIDRNLNMLVMIAHEIDSTNYEVAISQDGFFYIGVSAVRIVNIDSTTESYEGAIAWSYKASDCQNGVTFGIREHKPPGQTKNMR